MVRKLKSLFNTLMRGMNHDFCPNLNRYLYWLKEPIGWVVCGTLFSLLVGLMLGPQGFVLMWAFLALLALGVAWPWLSMKGLTCTLHFDESRSEENKQVKVILEITNRLPLPAFGLMLTGQFLQENSDDDPVAVALKRVSAWSISRFDWTIEPGRRGQLPTHIPLLSNVDGTASQRSGNDGETIGVREYREGDSIRNIHWNHTARCNRLIVREKQTLTQTPIRIVVDLAAERHSGEGGQSTFEWAIRVAASVCKQLHQHQAQVDLVCLGLPAGVPDRVSNRMGLQPVLDFLALLPQYVPQVENGQPDNSWQQSFLFSNQFSILIHTKALSDLTDLPNSTSRIVRIDYDRNNFAPTGCRTAQPTVAGRFSCSRLIEKVVVRSASYLKKR